MAATTSGALKAFLESPSLQLGVPVYRDQAPAGQKKPYIVVTELLPATPDEWEDGAIGTVREGVSIDIWMAWKDLPGFAETKFADGTILESYALPMTVAKALSGARLATAPTTVYGIEVIKIGPRLLSQEENNVHVPIQVDIFRAA